MKKVICIVIFILVVTILAGCGKNNGNNEGAKVAEPVEVTVNDLPVKLDTIGTFNDVSFYYPEGSKWTAKDQYNIDYYTAEYHEGHSILFRVALEYSENKTIDEVMGSKNASNDASKTINGIEWQIYNGENLYGDKTIYYAYRHNNDTYTILFMFGGQQDKNFVDVFMNTVTFN